MTSPVPSGSAVTPVPPVPLQNHCSIIFNSNGVDVLYTYQSNAFQSLPLQTGGKWQPLPMGVAVNGGKCVLGQWNHQDALIVVGGTPVDPAQKDFPGLQFFSFTSRTWQTSTPSGASVTQNRQMHNAVFLNNSNSLLVYSGFQDNSFKQSAETFTIVAEPPYISQSHPSPAPAGMNPILVPWNGSHAVMLGGSQNNRGVWLFSKEQEWKQIGVNIPNSIVNMSSVQATTMTGENDAKSIQIFDLGAAPNTVTSVVIQAADSNPSQGTLKTRDLGFPQIPPYNATGSSIVERNGYSLAQSRSSGLVVGSGGTGDAASPIVMFNQTANGWIQPKAFFSGQSQVGNNNIQSVIAPTAAATATSALTSASASAAAASSTGSTSTTAAAAPSSSVATGGDGLGQNGRTILGAVLGSLAGLGALLILILLILRWRKQKRKSRAKLYHNETKTQMGFDDTDAVTGFQRSLSRASKHSTKDEWQRMPTAQEKLGATISKPNLVYDSLSPTGIGSREITQPHLPKTLLPTKTKSDDGWSAYFGKSGSNNALMSDTLRLDSASRQTEYTMSSYDHESHAASVYHDQDHDTVPLNPRSSGYPQSEESWEQSKLHPGRQREPSSSIYRPGSAISEEEPEQFLNISKSSTGTQAWDSLGPGDGTGGFDRRPTSSMYAESINYPHPGDKVNISGQDSSSTAPKSNSINNSWRAPKDVTTSNSNAPKDDMSWLNLGTSK